MHSPSLICTTPREHQAFLGIIRPPNRDLAMAHGHPRLERKIPYAALAARGVLITIGAALTVTFQKPMSILDGNTVRPLFSFFPSSYLDKGPDQHGTTLNEVRESSNYYYDELTA